MITYVKGDATAPQGGGIPFFIVHIVNDMNRWGSGFVVAVSRKWPFAKKEYHRQCPTAKLGDIQVVNCEPGIFVVNLWGQHMTVDTIPRKQAPPIRYSAVSKGLVKLTKVVKDSGGSVHMPRIGCGLAGGSWDKMAPIVEESLQGIPVMVYDLPR